jgi:hypothetical protein
LARSTFRRRSPHDDILLFGWPHLQKTDGHYADDTSVRIVTRQTENHPITLQSLDVVHLTLGSHQLEGKLVPLKKPLALLNFTADDSDTDGTAQRCEASAHAANPVCNSRMMCCLMSSSNSIHIMSWIACGMTCRSSV